jgi:glycosyltransferase involved in cell wall biosynthesis
MKLLFVVNVDWFFLSHRLPIALEAKRKGFEVHIATGITSKLGDLQSEGFIVHPLDIDRSSAGLFSSLNLVWQIYQVFRRVRPDLVHLVTIKPILFGGLAARLARVPALVAAISGLGFVFIADGTKAKIRRWLVGLIYGQALKHKRLKIIFQNTSDQEILRELIKFSSGDSIIIRGSGIDLEQFTMKAEPSEGFVVAMACRLLREKGVYEFVDAARLLSKRGLNARFWLIGDIDPCNPSSVTKEQLSCWKLEGFVDCLGQRSDIANLYALSNLVVLPSYYGEGLPKTLIEAAACGRAIVTTDMPGCRDAIEPNVTGLIIPPCNAGALADAIETLQHNSSLRKGMGEEGRKFAEREFDIKGVVDSHLRIYTELLEKSAQYN